MYVEDKGQRNALKHNKTQPYRTITHITTADPKPKSYYIKNKTKIPPIRQEREKTFNTKQYLRNYKSQIFPVEIYFFSH